jgi:putative transposase
VDTKRKCELLNVVRSSMYYKPKEIETDDAFIMNEMQDIYQTIPVYGYRRVTVELRSRGFFVNHKKVQRLMQAAGRKAIYPEKKTTIRNHDHKVFKYLLRGLKIESPNQVWQVDITYIRVGNGFVYLTCLIDVFSRKIMGWSLSTFLDTASCFNALHSALKHGMPEIVNSDQGCQFTSAAWVDELQQQGIFISMDGKGRWADNVYVERLWRTIKQEAVRLFRFDTVEQARIALSNFIDFYNKERFHQALNYHTPNAIYALKSIPTKKQLFEQFALKHRPEGLEVVMTPK